MRLIDRIVQDHLALSSPATTDLLNAATQVLANRRYQVDRQSAALEDLTLLAASALAAATKKGPNPQ